ncbi:Molybdopterin molybdenumtransferase / Periplasmic molybdate-binding domain [hydrothermal vent metagenome]|uniref:Molybdopterin molybdenumtransferase / Periplasmic molybdate-binding domain n=1 Tax=hydrothermal vent metagenome TaxID=652676 RepID=A0A3B1E766_9ZZZZ
MQQQQFLNVVSKEDATTRFHAHLPMKPIGEQILSLTDALGAILAEEIIALVDVPGFDRSNVDGFAIRADDSMRASEESPCFVQLNEEKLPPGKQPQLTVTQGTATPIATGAMVPRGANAIVMIEQTDVIDGNRLEIRTAVAAGENLSFAGTDIAQGETILRMGQELTSREIGMLAAIGIAEVTVYRKPTVAVISTGNEIVAPGLSCPAGYVYDSNAAILSAAIIEAGGTPVNLGIVVDDEEPLRKALAEAMPYDMIVLSGGTSKGEGDVTYRILTEGLKPPGIVTHGVSLKPGKPICLAVSDSKPIVVLPGFPTSAVFTFHEFVVPVIRAMAGRKQKTGKQIDATLPMKLNSVRGRTEYLLVRLIETETGFSAYPMGRGSGSVTTFSLADGFISIADQTEIVDAGTTVSVQLISEQMQPADLVVMGSHCPMLDYLLGEMQKLGFTTQAHFIGSMGGLHAAKRGECDIAGIHLLDESTGEYNKSFLTDDLEWVKGYRRMQSILHRPDDLRFAGKEMDDIITNIVMQPNCMMVNRNGGSGTRIVIDRLLQGKQPEGYGIQAKTHNAVAAAIQQQRADWGVAIANVAEKYQLENIPVIEEHYDFIVPKKRINRPAVRAFCHLLHQEHVQVELTKRGFGR